MHSSLSRGAKVLALAAGSSALLAGAATAAAPNKQPSIIVRAAAAPNGFGSPSFAPWRDNAVAALQAGHGEQGSGVARYRAVTRLAPREWIVTGFHSWRGSLDPGNDFGATYAGEYGNRLTTTFRVKAAKGRKVNIANHVHITFDAPGPINDLDLTDADGPQYGFPAGAYTDRTEYTANVRGIDFGADRRRGTGDDVVHTSGTGAVDEIVGVSPGNSYEPDCASFNGCATPADQQAAYDAIVDTLSNAGGSVFHLKVKYGTRQASTDIDLTS